MMKISKNIISFSFIAAIIFNGSIVFGNKVSKEKTLAKDFSIISGCSCGQRKKKTN